MSKKKHWRVHLPKIIGGVLATILISVMIYFISNIEQDEGGHTKKKIQPITLLKPPPPPPPPPKIEKPPEPEIEKKIEEPEPEPEPENLPDVDDAPAADDLGLDADGSAGSDGFGLAARKGGKGLFGGGGPGAGYAGLIKNQVLDLLSDQAELRQSKYSVTVKIWFDLEGNVERYELVKLSQDASINAILKAQFDKMKKLRKAPPVGVSSPVKLRITSRI